MKKQSLIKGTLILGGAGIFSKFLGIFFRWPLIMLIGDEGVGLYQMSYPLFMFLVAIATGIPVAISKLVAERNAVNDIDGSFQVLKESLKLMVFLGTGLSLILFFFARPIVTFLKWDNKAYYSLLGVSLAPFFIYIMDAFRGFFQGHQNMTPTAASQVVEQIGRVLGGVGLAFLLYPKGIEYAAGGAAFGATAGGFLGDIYLIGKYLKFKMGRSILKLKGDPATMKNLIHMALPISLGAAASTVMTLIDSALVPQKLLEAGFNQSNATILFGQLTGKASVLINIPLTVSIALGSSIVPIIAEAYSMKRYADGYRKIDNALMLSAVLAIPCTLGLYYMAHPILNLVFPGKGEGYLILKYLSLSIPFIILAQTTTSVLQGAGYYVKPVINLLIGCVVKILLTLMLVPRADINIYGAVIASIGAYVTAALLNVYDMKKLMSVGIDYYKLLIRPAYASVVMIISVLYTYAMLLREEASQGIACLISIFVGIIIYVIFILAFGVIDYDYVRTKIYNQLKK